MFTSPTMTSSELSVPEFPQPDGTWTLLETSVDDKGLHGKCAIPSGIDSRSLESQSAISRHLTRVKETSPRHSTTTLSQ